MRSLTRDELQKIWNEEDMLKGNISRMCVTDDMEEFERMFEFAKKRILTIYTINLFRLRDDIDTIFAKTEGEKDDDR